MNVFTFHEISFYNLSVIGCIGFHCMDVHCAIIKLTGYLCCFLQKCVIINAAVCLQQQCWEQSSCLSMWDKI